MTEQEYAEHVDRRHEELRERMQDVLRELSTAFAEEGYIASPVYDRTDEEYGYAFIVSGGNLVEEVDVSLTLAESFSYGDLDGVSFALDVVAFGGEIIGGLTPYNYTPDCWVPVDDAEAVSDRLAIIEQADTFKAVQLVRDWAEQKVG